MPNGKCALHGGKSTGAKTAMGREKIRQAHLKHGMYTAEMIALRRQARALLNEVRDTVSAISKYIEESI